MKRHKYNPESGCKPQCPKLPIRDTNIGIHKLPIAHSGHVSIPAGIDKIKIVSHDYRQAEVFYEGLETDISFQHRMAVYQDDLEEYKRDLETYEAWQEVKKQFCIRNNELLKEKKALEKRLDEIKKNLK